jgi:hypothetical protein
MAYLTGIIQYKGSFKSIRHWTNANDPTIYAGEKGGANRDLIMNNPAFDVTRKNMSEFKGCGIVVKAIRYGLQHLIPEYTDTRFTGRLVALVKMINIRDEEGIRGKRAIRISLNRPILKTMNLHEKKKIDYELKRCISSSHPDTRVEATIMVNGLNPGPELVPGNPQYYRMINHLSIISDYAFSENMRRYEPLNPVNGTRVFAYTDYTPINTPLTVALKAAFPEGTLLSETDTVLQCVGIEFYIRSGADGYIRYTPGSMLVYDVF